MDIVEAARETLGTPFRHQGRLLGEGLDCAGMVVYAARRAGYDVFDIEGYGPNPANGQLEDALDMQTCLYQVPVPMRESGDLLLLRFLGEPQHLAICAGSTMIHAYLPSGKCCEHDIDTKWAIRIVRVYRFTEL